MTGIKVDVREIIYREIGIRANQKATSLPFPYLIHALCKVVTVPPVPKHDIIAKAVQDIDISRINDATDKVVDNPPEPSLTPPPASATLATSSGTPSIPATSISTPRPATAPLPASLSALSKLGLLAQHANAIVDKLTKELPSLIRQALAPIQTSVIALQKQHLSYEDRLKHFEVHLKRVERGEVGDMPQLKKEVAELKGEEQGTGTSHIPSFNLDITNLTAGKVAQGTATSQAPGSIVHIDEHSKEEFEGYEEENDEDGLLKEDEGQRDNRGKHIDISTETPDEEEAVVQTAIAHSIADMVAKDTPSTMQPSLGKGSISHLQDPALQLADLPLLVSSTAV
uniref:Microtubule-associated protein RP/EB family member 1-like n=1 Tax=Nicotiana sylvestris TaxID=4096 RepID=A0A1U7X1X0_NICSY|nr:PREDICTED: microtubule-associated protein RP/EB family member 1-like [Nicotiana sylvestris]